VTTEPWQRVLPGRKRIITWGAGDQARVNRRILSQLDCELVALVDDTPDLPSPFPSIPLLRGWTDLERWLRDHEADTLGFVVAIGAPYGHMRCKIHDRLSTAGLAAVSIVDPSAQLCVSAAFGAGLQVMPGALVHSEAQVGRQCLLNTRSVVEHDCVLEDGVEIGPGAVLAGRVYVGANSWICTGASVAPRVRIGRNAIIGAGAAVVDDIPDGVVAVGVPARPIPGRTTPAAEAGG
jgi:sugar O-acyltransferase (sialic acid O-acetyltransferase NeuD family)